MMSLLQQYFPFLRRVTIREKAFFARQLSTMLDSGLPLAQAISIIGIQTTNEVMREALATMVHDLEHGYSFSAAITKHPKIFNRVFVAAVRAGEAAGKLDVVLNDLATRMEKESETISKVRGALMYPIFVICAMGIVVIIMSIYVLPQIKPIFDESGADLPFMTRLMMGFSTSLIYYWWIYIVAIIFVIYGIRFYIKTDEGRDRWNVLKIRFPVLGPIQLGTYMSRFAGTLGMLIGAGVPIIEALRIVADIIDNEVYREGLHQVADEVSRGVPMSVPLQRNKYFPIIVSQMAVVGEQTGKLDEVFIKLAHYYEGETDETIKGVSSLLEPIILVVIGIGVAFVVFSIIMPIYNLTSQIK